jgi:hypothetical protein
MSCDTSGLEVLSKLFYSTWLVKTPPNFYANCYFACIDAKTKRLANLSFILNRGGLRQCFMWPNDILKVTCTLWRNIGDFYHAAAEILILKLPANRKQAPGVEIFAVQ